MANMYPNNLNALNPTDSERIVYHELKTQLPDTFDVFYSVRWMDYEDGKPVKSEADFVVTSPEYGFLCLEVKGGNDLEIVDNQWILRDAVYGDRKLTQSPYDQAEKSMYHFEKAFRNKYNMKYTGTYGYGVVLPFYAVSPTLNLDNRQRECTIDSGNINNLFSRIKKMFRMWAGHSYGRILYPIEQHNAFMQLVRERIAISAAAGALVKYKEQQLDVINRVQDNYIYFLSNVPQFYIRGGAGTGKSWVAMKMARQAAEAGSSTLFLCRSERLAAMVQKQIGDTVTVRNVPQLFAECIENFESFAAPFYEGVFHALKPDTKKYDAVFVDEAQDFTHEWARTVRCLLTDPEQSRFGIFYDDVQVLREDSFGDGFGIAGAPYLLHENIRNTANIYQWTADKTNLGTDVITNPVEGPNPDTQTMHERGQLTLTLETLFHRFLVDEHLENTSLVLLTDDLQKFMDAYPEGIARWHLVNGAPENWYDISVYSAEEFKGLESDMVIYIHAPQASENMNYIAYTRAKYYLIEIVKEY